jgi:hypothetical protein
MAQRPTRSGDNRVRLRRDLLDVRWPIDQIAEEIQRRFGDSPLAAFRHALGLSQADVAARWDTICGPRGDVTMTGTRLAPTSGTPLSVPNAHGRCPRGVRRDLRHDTPTVDLPLPSTRSCPHRNGCWSIASNTPFPQRRVPS